MSTQDQGNGHDRDGVLIKSTTYRRPRLDESSAAVYPNSPYIIAGAPGP